MKVFGALLLACALAACSGGGGGGAAVAPLPPPNTGLHTPTLAAGFSQSSGTATASTKRYRASALTRTDALSLGGGVLPFAIFWIPDSYVPTGTSPIIGAEEVAYVTGGTVTGPTTVTFTDSSGPTLPVVATPSPIPQPPGLPSGAQIIGGQLVGAPSTVGQSVVTVAAIGQSVNITADTYPGLMISTATGSTYNAPAGLTCTASGCTPTPNGSTPDISITSGTPSSFVAPNGIVEVPGKTIDQVTSADFVNPVTTLPVSDLCTSTGSGAFIFKAASGVYVKMSEETAAGSNLNQGVCDWTDFFGPYLASDASGNFTY